jgi:hypothetical protein
MSSNADISGATELDRTRFWEGDHEKAQCGERAKKQKEYLQKQKDRANCSSLSASNDCIGGNLSGCAFS